MDDRDAQTRGRTVAHCLVRPAPDSTPGANLAAGALVAVCPSGSRVHGIGEAARPGFSSWRRWVMTDPCDLEPVREREHDLALIRAERAPGDTRRGIPAHLLPEGHSPLEVLSLRDALTRSWPDDAHMIAGVLHSPDGMALARQPRVNGAALDPLRSLGFSLRFGVVFAEADRGDKATARWSSEAMEHAAAVLDGAAELEGLAWHFTRGGLHVLGVLAEPLDDPRAFERALAWLRERIRPALARIPTAQTREHPQPHLVPDEAVKEWARMFRLPLVVRDGERQRWAPDLSRLEALRPSLDAITVQPARRVFVRPGLLGSFSRAERECPAEWVGLVPAIARAMREDESAWNAMFLYVAGALCESGVPTNDVPAIVQALSDATGRDDRERFETCGVQTVRKASLGGDIAGMRALEAHSPAVAEALGAALREWSQGATRGLPSIEDARAELRAFIGQGQHGATIAAVGTGIGKSHAAIDEAARRAEAGFTASGRAAPNAKTGIAAPTTQLARELFEKAAARGIPTARVFSPAALETEAGRVCRIERRARAVARAGLSIVRELCKGRGKNPCAHREGCAAAEGIELVHCDDPSRALLVIGPHALAGRIAKMIGASGKLFIDEPPSAIEETIITRAQLALLQDETSAGRGIFEPDFAHALGPVVDRLAAALDGAELPHGGLVLAPGLIGAKLLAALALTKTPNGPPVRETVMISARRSDSEMERIEQLCAVARLLDRVAKGPLTSDGEARWTIGANFDRFGARLDGLVFTGPQQELEAALARRTQVVFLDASPDVAALSRLAGYPIDARRIATVVARDAHPVERAVIEWKAGTRTALRTRETTPDKETIASGLRVAIRWALEDPTAERLLFVSFKAVREHIEHELREPSSEVARAFAPWLEGGRRSVDFLHFGNVRGYDQFRDHDAVITFGTPRENMDACDRAAAHLGIDDAQWSERSDWLARRELEQAHGRLRFPSRSRRARALHMGELLPLGVGWERAAVLPMPRGRLATLSPSQAVAAVAQHGSQRAAARRLGVDERTVRRAVEGAAIQLCREDTPTMLNRRTPADRAETQFTAENTRQSNETGAGSPVGLVSHPGTHAVSHPGVLTVTPKGAPMDHEQFIQAVDALAEKLRAARPAVAVLLGVSERTFKAYCTRPRPGRSNHRTPPRRIVDALRAALEAHGIAWPVAA